MMPGITVRVKTLSFNSAVVRKAVDAAKRRVMSKQGAFVRTAARRLIRRRKKPSAPGQPPSSRTGILKKLILFSYDPTDESVVIGPARTDQPLSGVHGETTPQVLEYGGVVLVREVLERGQWRRATARRLRGNRPTRVRKVRIARRPYMTRALVSARRDLAKHWKDSVR